MPLPSRAIAALPLALLTVVLSPVAGAAAAEFGAPASTASGTCIPGEQPFASMAPTPPSASVFSVSATGGALTVWDDTMDDGDLVWDATVDRPGPMSCNDAPGPVSFAFEAHATPATPVTYRGRGARMVSIVAVQLPFTGALAADTTATDGTVSIAPVDLQADPPVGTASPPTGAPATTSLGVRPAGRHLVLVDPGGARPNWTAHFRVLPATISGLQLPGAISSTAPTITGQYVLDQPGRVTVDLLNGAGALISKLQSPTERAAGTYPLTWDAKTARPARPVNDGRYVLRISGLDAGGGTSVASAPVLVDRSGPVVTPREGAVLLRDPMRFTANDTVSGLTAFRVTLPETTGRPGVVSAAAPDGAITIAPPTGGWKPGKHTITVEAVDGAGNRTTRTFPIDAREVFGEPCGRSAALGGVLNSAPVMKALRATRDAKGKDVAKVFTLARVLCSRLDKDVFREMVVLLRRKDKRKGSITPLIVFRVSDKGLYTPRVITTRYAVSGLSVRARQVQGNVRGGRRLTVRDAGGKLVLSVKKKPSPKAKKKR